MSRFERWSRRKLGQETDDPSDAPDQAAEEALEAGPDGADDTLGDAPLSEPAPGSLDATLPDPDTLPAGADFSAYLAKGVSRQLRRRALRRLWSSGGYGVRDGLDDYDENYREVLKPLARDLADQLRRWTRPEPEVEVEEAQAHDDARPAAVEQDPAQDQSTELGDAVAQDGEPQDAESGSPSGEDEAKASRPLDQGSVGLETRTVKD